MKLNFEKLIGKVENLDGLNEDQKIVRELLEICSNVDTLTLEFIEKIQARHIIMAKKELESMEKSTLNDMVIFEYMLENIQSCSTIEDDEEIY